ncbi:MAG: S-layer homology domain-containing protein [Ezakiella sp.]|nr:S-layer homology domain-containing protein [Ezakiella sp.]
MKRTISILLSVLMVLTLIPADIWAADATTVDEAKTNLADALSQAKDKYKELSQVIVADNAADVPKSEYYIATSEEEAKHTFISAYEAAKAVDQSSITLDNLAAINSKINALNTAYEAAKNITPKQGTKEIDKTKLKTAIDNAKEKIKDVKESDETNPDNIEKGKKVAKKADIDAFNTAIEEAEKVNSNENATQTDVDTATSKLIEATTNFNFVLGKKETTVTVDKSKLAEAIEKAKKYKDILVLADGTDPATIENGKNYIEKKDEDKKTKLNEEIKLADAINSNSEATQEQVDDEAGKLVEKTNALTAVIKKGTKPVPTKIALKLFRNHNSSDDYSTPEVYNEDVKLKDIYEYSRTNYRFLGWSYTRGGSLISGETTVDALTNENLYAQWQYIGDYYDYYRPTSLEWTYNRANEFKRDYAWEINNAPYELRRNFENAYDVVKKMYNSSNWYRRGRYYDGRYYNGYYDGSDYYYNGNWYSYNEFKRVAGYYPDDRYGRYYDPYYDRYYDGYYYNEYYDSSYRANLEDLIDAIREIARYYPHKSIYDKYANLSYPDYRDDYYYGYYDGYYSDSALLNLINEGEDLYNKIKNRADKKIVKELRDAIDNASSARRGRTSYPRAYDRLEAAIKAARPYEKAEVFIRNAYMKGNTQGNFMPEATLTRAEVSQIIANLLKQSGKTTVYMPKAYDDVAPGAWYKEAVDLASSYGIMTGKPGNKFDPQGIITKAELVTIAARLKGYEKAPGNIFGLKTHYWAHGYIQRAYVEGWIEPSNGFVPAAPITRAETVHILNGALKYGPDKDYIIKLGNTMVRFNDVTRTTPYYFDIMTATNTISYIETNTGRLWKNHKHPTGIWSNKDYTAGTNVAPLN